MGCPWVSPSVNNEVGRSGWKKGYFHCSSDVTFSTGFFPQDSFSYFLFRFPAPHSSFGILDIVLFCFRLVLLFPSPRGTKRLALEGSSTLRGNLHLPSQTYILQGCPRTPLELTIYPRPNFCSSLRYGVEGEFSWLCGRLLFLVLFQQCGDHL